MMVGVAKERIKLLDDVLENTVENENNIEIGARAGRFTSECSDLLCCPFCGGMAELDTMRPYRPICGGAIREAVSIYCDGGDGCPAEMSICKPDVPDATTEQLVSELTSLWNRRVT